MYCLQTVNHCCYYYFQFLFNKLFWGYSTLVCVPNGEYLETAAAGFNMPRLTSASILKELIAYKEL